MTELNTELNSEQGMMLNFSSLVDYYINNKVQNISLVKKLVIKQEISFSYEWFIHKHMRSETPESYNFSTYICLIQAEPEYYGNYIEMMIEDFKVPAEIIEKCLQNIRSGFIPYQIWIDKCISDLKGSDYYSKTSVAGMLLVYLMRTMKTSILGYMKLHNALLEASIDDDLLEVVAVANAMFLQMPKELKDDYMQRFSSEDESVRRAFCDNELMLFTETIIDMTQYPLSMQMLLAIENGKLPEDSDFWVTPMVQPAPIVNRSRIALKVEETEEVPEEVTETVEETPVTEYLVEKVATDSSNRVMSKNTFDSEGDAVQFIEDVVNAVPDITNYFQFRINGVPYTPKRNR